MGIGWTKSGILGAADGVTSVAGGVIAGGAAAGVDHSALAATAIGGALAATVSMGGAELLSEEITDWAAVAAIGIGTICGAALPAIPLLFISGVAGWVSVALIAAAVAVVVGEFRHRSTCRHRLNAYLLTATVICVGAGVGWAAGHLGGVV